jgi:hypothetical protein
MTCVGAAGADVFLHADLTNSAENPPTVPTTSVRAPGPASFGTADFVLNTAATSFTFASSERRPLSFGLEFYWKPMRGQNLNAYFREPGGPNHVSLLQRQRELD